MMEAIKTVIQNAKISEAYSYVAGIALILGVIVFIVNVKDSRFILGIVEGILTYLLVVGIYFLVMLIIHSIVIGCVIIFFIIILLMLIF